MESIYGTGFCSVCHVKPQGLKPQGQSQDQGRRLTKAVN